jgi:hypothetical protein
VVAHIVSNRKDKSDNERFIEALALIEDYQLSGTVDWIFYQLIPDQVDIIRRQGITDNALIIERLCPKDKALIIEVVEAAFLGLQPIIPCKRQ